MAKMTFEESMDAKERAHLKADDKYMDRMGKRWDAAEAMIGELCREGKKVFYVSPQGGKYREGTKQELSDFLIRNNYA